MQVHNKKTPAHNPQACVLLIGNELLSGQTQDKNLSYIAQQLLTLGIRVAECRVIPDIEGIIIQTLNECREKFDYVLTTGGIGPTHDDITTHCVAKAFNVPLERLPEISNKLKERMGDRFNDASLKMAEIPQGAKLIENPVTAAPGFIMDNVYVMAGIPAIMRAMLESFLPTLKNGKPFHRSSIFCDLPESHIAPGLHQIQETYSMLEIGSYPHWEFSEYRLNLIVRGTDQELVHKATYEIEALIVSLHGTILNPKIMQTL